MPPALKGTSCSPSWLFCGLSPLQGVPEEQTELCPWAGAGIAAPAAPRESISARLISPRAINGSNELCRHPCAAQNSPRWISTGTVPGRISSGTGTVPDVFPQEQEQSRDGFSQEQSQMDFLTNRNSPRWISSAQGTGTVLDGFRRGGFRGWRCWGEQGQLSTSPGCSSPTSLYHGQQSLLLPQRRTAPNCGFGSASSLCGAEKGTHRSRQVLFKEVDVLKVV